MNRITRYRIESGYDTSGQLVLNVFSLDTPTDPFITQSEGLLQFRLAAGKLVVFDELGKPLPLVLPDNAPMPNPLRFLGLRPGFSVLEGIRVSNLNSFAQSRNATVEDTSAASCNGCSSGGTYKQMRAPVESGSSVWTYQMSGNTGTLVSVSTYSTSNDIQASSVAQISNLTWYVNASNDTARAAQGSTAQAPPSVATSQLSQQQAAPPPEVAAAPDPACSKPVGSGQNIVFQHGLVSSCRTWDRMYPWLKEKFQFGQVIIPSLSSTSRLESQATSLRNLMAASGRDGFIIVGHSQGGLIGRDVLQRDFAQLGGLTRGIATVSTPHQGAYIARTSRIAAALFLQKPLNNLFSRGRCSSPWDNEACFLAYVVATYSANYAINFAFDTAVPATTDLVPGSAYLQALNSVPESFIRVGVESKSTQRWVEMRLVGDLLCNPEEYCGGRAFYVYTQIVYFSLRACQVIAWFFGRPDIAAFCGGIATAMNVVDFSWDLLTSPGEGSDGIVQASSQVYPIATARYVISGADSHVGATRSDKVRPNLEQTLAAQFQLVRNGCTYSISTASASFPASGGAGSFTVTPSAGCAWSSVSGTGWVKITGGSTGSGPGTVSYSVSPNLDPVP